MYNQNYLYLNNMLTLLYFKKIKYGVDGNNYNTN